MTLMANIPTERRRCSLEGRDIVFVSHQRWNTHTTAVQNTVVRLARHNRVLFVEPPDSMAWLRTEPAAREALSWGLSPLEKRSENLFVYHTPPVFLPGQARAGWIARSITRTYAWMIRRACRQLGIDKPILWIYQFNCADLIRRLDSACAVYECAEEWDQYETDPVVKRYIQDKDADLCRTADAVIVPSREMLQRKAIHNDSTHLVPWGVDVKLYSRARDAETAIPQDIRSFPRPVIGMFGMLDGRRLHTELLRQLAERHPEWSIVLIGRCMPNLDRATLDRLPNVHFLGMQPVEQIPAYCKAFDVCMIPYMLNDFTRSIMPLKIAEYLATGKPVVSTALPAALELQDVIDVARDAEEFEREVLAALREDPLRAERRIRRAADYDWDLLVERRAEIVRACLDGVPPVPKSEPSYREESRAGTR